MDSMKTYLLVWLGGVIAGVIIMESWRRTGRGLIPTAASTADAVETTTATDASKGHPTSRRCPRSSRARRPTRTGSATLSGE